MKQRIIRFISLGLIAAIIPFSLFCFAFLLPAQYKDTYLSALSVKWLALKQDDKPRIIIAGGSGTAFDLRCDLLEEELSDYHAVNFGLYAGLGTTVMLDLLQSQIREGDVVIFMPELSAQTLSDYFNAEAMWQATDGDFEPLLSLPYEYFGRMAGAFPTFAASKMRYRQSGDSPKGDGVYASSSFNRYGDISYPDREYNTMPGGYDENMRLSFDTSMITDAFLDKVNLFSDICEKKNVSFFYRFCPMNQAALLKDEEKKLTSFTDYLSDQLSCEILGDPAEAILEPEWFYDTNFHLNCSGAVVNTALLIKELKAVLGDESKTEIALPPMPVKQETDITDGDNSDLSCFLFEETGDTATVVGLTEEGKEREKLTLPTLWQEKSITGISAAVFAGNQTLREITVQKNIRSLPNKAFNGCGSLEKLVIRNDSPASINVGAELLFGCDALIYVPSDGYSAYCTNYFWSVYAARIRAHDTPSAKQSVVPNVKSAGDRIAYSANGGALLHQDGDSFTEECNNVHLRQNTVQGASYCQRDGYVLIGWNTKADGSGTHIGLGSRVDRTKGLTLYAQWMKATDETEFDYILNDDSVTIISCRTDAETCVIPETIEGKPVREIRADAFLNKDFSTLVLPSSLRDIEERSFVSCSIKEIYLFDSISAISDSCFKDCRDLTTLHINAATTPVYSGSYYDTFSDKLDYLLSVKDEQKIVLASGSSGRYGYDSAAIETAFPQYRVVNMGVYAYSNAKPQLEIIREFMQQDDILLSAPEFDAIEEQFCVSDRPDHHFWAMMESNYDAAAILDLSSYSGVFDSFGEYLKIRSGMTGKSYTVSPSGYDDEGNRYGFPTYNKYGDFILPRPNGDKDERQHLNTADYTVTSFPEKTIESLNAVYQGFLDKKITVYFSYTPRNRSSLTPESTQSARSQLHEYLSENICVPVISDIEDYLYSGVYFWKIDSHTSTEGAAIRTQQIIKDLNQLLH